MERKLKRSDWYTSMSALGPIADIDPPTANVRFVPMSGREQVQQDMDRQTYSITSSAMLSSVGGTTRPSDLAVW